MVCGVGKRGTKGGWLSMEGGLYRGTAREG